jgi:hypothetical protein
MDIEGLEEWAARSSSRRVARAPCRRLRFAFYGRASTEDWQDPASSWDRQREQAGALVRGHGAIVAEFFDIGEPERGMGSSAAGRSASCPAGRSRPGLGRCRDR